MAGLVERSQSAFHNWSNGLAQVCVEISRADSPETDVSLRSLRALLAVAPAPVPELLGTPPDSDMAERLLACDAATELALRLAGSRVRMVILSRSPEGLSIATLEVPGLFADVTAEGPNDALAIANALIAGLSIWFRSVSAAAGSTHH